MYDLSKLKLLARGGQAEIYEIDSEKILRVLLNKEYAEQMKAEFSIMKELKDIGKNVPETYEYLMINGRPAIVMQRIPGISMSEKIGKNPFNLYKHADLLAQLHLDLLDSEKEEGLVSVKERASLLIPMTEMLNTEQKNFALKVLEELEEGNELCHGDFHPGNILISNSKYYIIDWFSATSGPKISDIAHTYLLLRNTPRLPGSSRIKFYTMRPFIKALGSRYLKTCYQLFPFDRSEFSHWLIVRAAERVFYGMPSEKASLIKFIDVCMQDTSAGKLDEAWKLL